MINKLFMDVYARVDPIRNFNFTVQFGSAMYDFQKVSGLKSDVDVVEYREGDDFSTVGLTVRKLPGLVKYDPITCEKGVIASMQVPDEFITISGAGGAVPGDDYQPGGTTAIQEYRGTLRITAKSRSGEVVRVWECANAWVSSYEVGEVDAQGNAVLIERLVFQHEGFTVVSS